MENRIPLKGSNIQVYYSKQVGCRGTNPDFEECGPKGWPLVNSFQKLDFCFVLAFAFGFVEHIHDDLKAQSDCGRTLVNVKVKRA